MLLLVAPNSSVTRSHFWHFRVLTFNLLPGIWILFLTVVSNSTDRLESRVLSTRTVGQSQALSTLRELSMLLIVFAPTIVPPFLQAWVTLLSEVYS